MDESDTDFDTVEIYCLDIVKRHFSNFIVTDITFFNIKLIFIRIVSNMFFFFRYQLFLVLLRNSLYPFRTTCSHFIPPENTTKILRFSHQVPVFSYIYFCKGVAVNNYWKLSSKMWMIFKYIQSIRIYLFKVNRRNIRTC